MIASTNNLTGNRLGDILDQGTDTQLPAPSADTQPPTMPTNVAAEAVSASLVRLTWAASTDNVGVQQYRIYRNGSTTPLASVGGTTLTYDDSTVAASTTYSYVVDAVDAAGNASPPSEAASVTTSGGTGSDTRTFNPVADSYVTESSPTGNFGNNTLLRVDNSPVTRSYLRFDVRNLTGTVTSATLRVWAPSNSNRGHEVHPVQDTTWGETTITFGNAPQIGGVAAASGAFSGAPRYIEVDITSLISGNGLYSVALTGPSDTAVSYQSDEATNRPQLVVTTAAT